jgi:hypothetical protein
MKHKLKGDGVFDDAKNFFNKTAADTTNLFNKTTTDANDFITKVKYGRTDLSPKVKNILDQYGDAVILKATVGRKPITQIIGMIVKTISNTPYDTLFHLFIQLETTKGRILIEKNAQINLDVNRDVSNAQYMPVENIPQGLTVNQLMLNTKNKMGDKFIPYSAKNNNCQNFIMNLLKANQMDTPELIKFVKQDTEDIFKDDNFKNFANTITDLGNRLDIIRQGGNLQYGRAINETSNYELDKLMKHYKIKNYHGCYIKNELPQTLKNGFYIVNLNGSSHWTVLYKDGKNYFYFDSYGFVPPIEVERRIPKDYIYNDKQIQTLGSTACGFYCVAFCRIMNAAKDKMKAYEKFIGSFGVSSKQNEKILKQFLS